MKEKKKSDDNFVINKLLPHNLEAEQNIIGSLLLNNDAISTTDLTPDDFYRTQHQIIYKAIWDLFDQGVNVNPATLASHLKEKGHLEDVGGASYIADIFEATVTAADLPYWAKVVKEKRIKRDLIEKAIKVIDKSFNGVENIEELINFAQSQMLNIEPATNGNYQGMWSISKEGLKSLERAFENKSLITGIPSGLEKPDRLLSGFQKSDLILVGARPSMGKTALAVNICKGATREGYKVGFFSLEMSKGQLFKRFLAAESHINLSKLRTGNFEDYEWSNLLAKSAQLAELGIFIDDSPRLSSGEINARARVMKKKEGIDLLIIDYLQRVREKKSYPNRHLEMSEIAQNLKSLAKELNIPIVALSQLNRGVEARNDKRPTLADLKESGDLEQEADIVIFLYRDDYYNQDSKDKGIAEFWITKHRNGPTGMIKVAWLDKYATFENLAGE